MFVALRRACREARSPDTAGCDNDAGDRDDGDDRDDRDDRDGRDTNESPQRLLKRAVKLYTEVVGVIPDAVRSSPDPAVALQYLSCYCNRSAAYAKLGEYKAAVRDADVVIAARQDADVCYVLKAYHRKAQALWAMGDKVGAVKAYKEAVSLRAADLHDDPSESSLVVSEGVQAAAMLMITEMPHTWLASYYMNLLTKSEAPHPWSRRDGLLLKRVPDSVKLDAAVVRGELMGGLDEDMVFQRACQKALVDLWGGTQQMKSVCAYVRGYVYYRASRKAAAGGDVAEASRDGLLRQGEMDATVALVYHGSAVKGPNPAAHALRGLCYEARGENVMAVLDVLEAIEGEAAEGLSWDDDNENGDKDGDVATQSMIGEIFEQTLERLLPRVPEHYAAAIKGGCGLVGLQKMMQVERERMQPEFLKKRPKYYYYYEWMKKRIRDRHPEIAEGVMDKLLALDAGELDLLLQYPQAIDATVHELEGVLEERGEDELERFEVPLLNWGDMQRLKLEECSQVVTVDGGSSSAALEGAA